MIVEIIGQTSGGTMNIARLFGVGGLVHVAMFAAVALHCMSYRRDSRSTILWLFFAWGFPIIGPLAYGAFGVSHVPKKAWIKHSSDAAFGAARKESETESHPLAYWSALRKARATQPPAGAEIFNIVLDNLTPQHPLLEGNSVELLEDGEETFPAMLTAIRGAKHHIHIFSYIIGADNVGRAILDACAAKAHEGVKVRIMYDAFGSAYARLTRFFRRYSDVPNMRVCKFSVVNIFKQQLQVNLRNHRKIFVVDGNVAFTGGINLHQDHMERDGVQLIRDYHFRLEGPLVNELQYTFLRDWYYMTDESPDELLSKAYFGNPEEAGTIAARMVNCGPTSVEHSIEEVFFSAVVKARNEILLVTPYLVLTEPLIYALRMTAMRGVHIRLILPAKNNHRSVQYASRAQYSQLLSAGIRIYERQGPFIHAKAMVVDKLLSIFGSANMDVRSLRLNYETAVVSYDEALATKLTGTMLGEIEHSDEISLNEWDRRPWGRRLLENAFALADQIL